MDGHKGQRRLLYHLQPLRPRRSGAGNSGRLYHSSGHCRSRQGANSIITTALLHALIMVPVNNFLLINYGKVS